MGKLLLLLLFGPQIFYDPQIERKWMVNAQQFSPAHDDREIDMTEIDFLITTRAFEKFHLTLMLGATASFARGEITQLEGSYEEGTFRSATYESDGNGLGPLSSLKLDLLHGSKLSLSLDVSSGVVFYDEPFPAGGTHYNGMFRAGPTLTYSLDDKQSVAIGYRWMHLSNGRGEGSDNPSYEGNGIHVQYARRL